MSSLLNMVEKELNIPKKQLLEEGVKHFLEIELKSLSIEIKKLSSKYGVNSFNKLWEKLESGELTESDCFDDLSKIEYLELEREKIVKLLEKTKRG